MIPTVTNRTFLVTLVVVGVIGAVDAAAGGSWDLVVILVFITLLHLGLLVRTAVGRPEVRVRADLVRWMRDRADTVGERIDDVADRAISTYRAGLLGGDPEPTPDARVGSSDERAEHR